MTATTTASALADMAGTDARSLEVRLDQLALQLDGVASELRAQGQAREMVTELLGDLAHVAGPALQLVTERLADAEAAGWFTFAQHAGGVLEQVVTSFDGDDLDALAQQIVLILRTVRDMTQPEVMTMLRRTVAAVGAAPAHDVRAPSLPHLLGELRDPDVRRGMERMLTLLRSVGDDDVGPADAMPDD